MSGRAWRLMLWKQEHIKKADTANNVTGSVSDALTANTVAARGDVSATAVKKQSAQTPVNKRNKAQTSLSRQTFPQSVIEPEPASPYINEFPNSKSRISTVAVEKTRTSYIDNQ